MPFKRGRLVIVALFLVTAPSPLDTRVTLPPGDPETRQEGELMFVGGRNGSPWYGAHTMCGKDDFPPLERAALIALAVVIAFFLGSVFYSFIGFEPPQWYRNIAGFLISRG